MTIRDPFDFFFGEILHLPPAERDPDHYTLLGLAFFEKNADRIRRAGHDRKRLLRSVPAGPPEFEHVRRQLVERVREARRTLLDATRREAYDAFLVGRGPPPEEPEFRLRESAEFAGRFRILKELRRGAFGRVYAALDGRAGQRVELSVLPPAASHDPARKRRALRAARALSRCDEPGVLGVIGVGEAEGLVHARWPAPHGMSLAQRVARHPRGRLDAGEAARIADGLADVLARLHAQGLVHGDLHSRNVFVTDDGRVEVAECGLAAAIAPEPPTSPYSAPERAITAEADRYALGALAYFLLQGEAPFLDGRRALVPKPLPDDVPPALAATVLGLLALEPSQRPIAPRFAAVPTRRRRWLPWVAAAALTAVVVAGVWLGGSGEKDRGTPLEQAWKRIGERRFDEAIRLLEAAGPDPAFAAPLASALEGQSYASEKGGDAYAAQLLLTRAQEIASDPGRAAELERVRGMLRARLDRVAVIAPAVTDAVVVRVEAGDAALSKVWLDGAPVAWEEPLSVARDEGSHHIAFALEDRAGNRREGEIAVVVDRTAPELTIRKPEEGRRQRDGAVEVVAEVRDEHPPRSVTIHGREAALEDGTARLRLNLPNGSHEIELRAADSAGNASRASVTVVIDDRAPEIVLDSARLVSRDGAVVVRGAVQGLDAKLTVDGVEADVERDGRFAVPLRYSEDRTVELVATGTTGVVNRAQVECVRDAAAPELEVGWDRRDARGRLLYGGVEMDAGVLPLALRAADDTALRFEPSEGDVRDGVWRLAPHEGERQASLAAVDEAGNRTTVTVRLAGHRAAPALAVTTPLGAITREERATLTIEADNEVYLGERRVQPGRIEVPLPEGENTLVVRAVDAYGNATVWTHRVVVDRTPPQVEVVGPGIRGVGRQELVLEADEELDSITCLTIVKEERGKRFVFDVDLEDGRTQIHVVARDLAGNVAKLRLPLRVVNRVLLLDGRSAVRVRIDPMPSDFTIEFWARGTPAIDPAVMASRGADHSWQVNWASEDEALPHALLRIAGEGPTTLVAKKLRDPGDWHHYALVRDGRKLRFFLDGKLQAFLETKLGLVEGGTHLTIGGSGLDEGGRVRDGFVGRIDELRLSNEARYNRAFKPARFLRADDRTRLLLRFDGMTDKKHPDASADGKDATAVGEPRLVVAQE